MKQEFDKQFDSLLRGTRGGADARHAAASDEHLSPDELSAYAENALPPAARSLYTAHLADCPDCRRVVTSVALASGAEAAREARPASVAAVGAVASKSSWGAWLGALLSPRALAYAAPVLAVAIIGALALVVLRSRQGAAVPDIAQQRSNEGAARPDSITQPAPAAGTSAPSAAANMDASQAQGSPASESDLRTARTEGVINAPAPVAKEVTQAEAKAGAKSEETKDSAAQPADADETVAATAAPKPAAEAAPPPAASVSTRPAENVAAAPSSAGARPVRREADDKQESRQQRSAADLARSRERGEDARRGAPEQERGRAMDRHSREDQRLYGERSKSDGTVPSEREGLASRKRSTGPARGAGGASAETRSVDGREFRRQGGAWVDVRYSSSMSTVKVRRGSESFRAIVADIPEVGRAAEQLPGTVIVVARGRAYRIN